MNVSIDLNIFSPVHLHKCLILFCMMTIGIGTSGIAGADDWELTPSPDWVQIEIPSGWTILKDITMADDNQSATFTARSPDWDSELVYILDHSKKDMSIDKMQIYQDQWMQGNGYRICQTKDPLKRTKIDHSLLKQVYVQGSNKGAVMYSASYPDWGQYHVALLMTGESAVQQYYDSLPAQIPDHIFPIENDEGIGTITFTPGV